MSDISLTPSDLVGAIQRGLAELAAYLNAPVQEINPTICVAHMERLTGLMTRLEAGMPQQAAANGNAREARTN